MDKPSHLEFDGSKHYWNSDINYREHPEEYRVGKDEQAVLICEPYEGELVGHWRFQTPETARAGSSAIDKSFLRYLRQGDFVGADMARKFLQMGFTRARRYANDKGGRKYDQADKHQLEKGTGDPKRRGARPSSTTRGSVPRRIPPTPG